MTELPDISSDSMACDRCLSISSICSKDENAWLTAEGNNAYVSWWGTHQDGTQEPVIRVSNDGGHSFGPMLKLSTNGIIRGVQK